MQELSFEDWWADFQSTHKTDKDGGQDKISHLQKEVGHWSVTKRVAFIDELLSRNHFEYACELIVLFGTDDQKLLIREKLTEWIDSRSTEMVSPVLIPAIIATFTENDSAILERYFRDERTYGNRVPAELYDFDRELFLKSFERFLAHYDDERLYQSDGLLYLTKHLESLEFLVNKLSKVQAERMKGFCLSKLSKAWLEDEVKHFLIGLSK